ncbi:MAG TPA: hypothetical protein VFH56_02745 [Acidimicrobiales bacterium]|nr:hypothetical protein [Acidimicrobiales bacterium]
MQVQPVAFTASGLIGHAGFTAAIDSPLTGKAFQPAYMDPSQGTDGEGNITAPAQAQRPVGFAFTGFTLVTLYNGTDNTGDVVAVASAAGVYAWNYEVNCQKGLYVEVTGTGKGTVWLA